jgi:asparagine synthase (glutamine-hydrolysing)
LIAKLFEPAVVAAMLERHRTGDANFTRELRALAALALWAADGAAGPAYP